MRNLTLILSLLFLAACDKGGDEDDWGITTTVETYVNVTFKNDLDRTYNVDVYLTQEDYINSVNADLSIRLKPGEKHSVTYRNHDTLHYVDVYTDDYTSNNWGQHTIAIVPLKTTSTNNYLRASQHVYFPPDQNFTFSHHFNPDVRGGREVLISGNKTVQSWKAIWSPNWNALTDEQKHHRLVLYKNLQAIYETKTGDGKLQVDSGFYFLQVYAEQNVDSTYAFPVTPAFYSNKLQEIKAFGKDSISVRTYQGDFFIYEKE